VAESINRDLELRVKKLTSELTALRQSARVDDRKSLVEELQAELARTNTKLAEVLQLVFRRNPSLAHELARIKV